jgi:flagellar basal body rod protein FlgG
MVSGISASLAGLIAFGKKVTNAAGNIANSNTDKYKSVTAHIEEDKAGLPEVTTQTVNTPGTLVHETDGTLRETSNVELSQEIPQLIVGQRGYEANLKALQTQDEMLQSVLNIKA